MKIYFAGEPGGNKREREKVMYSFGVIHRLSSFFYLSAVQITLELIKNENLLRRK